jgi:hypothetical protein
MRGWIELFVDRILADMVGPTLAPLVFGLLSGLLMLMMATPFIVLWTSRQVNCIRRTLAVAEEKVERLAQRHLEMHTLVKDSFALVQERLASVPPPVRFGPDGGAAGDAAAAPAPEGQGMYNYCPGCKEIRFIKFFRCQTCGFHVPR